MKMTPDEQNMTLEPFKNIQEAIEQVKAQLAELARRESRKQVVTPLKDFIREQHRSANGFAKVNHCTPKAARRWAANGHIVIGDQVYKPHRKIKTP